MDNLNPNTVHPDIAQPEAPPWRDSIPISTEPVSVTSLVKTGLILELERQIECNNIVMSAQDKEIARLKAIISNIQTVLGAK